MSDVLVEVEDAIGIVTVNRPDKLNSLSSEVRRNLAEAFEKFDNDESIDVCILAGSKSKAFIAGADIKEFSKMKIKNTEEMEKDWRITTVLSNMSKPVIAMIDGFCLGGGLELAMSCDMRLASDSSKLGQPEINIGIIPGAGGTQRLTRLIGEGRAMEMILSGKMITASKAEQYGLVNAIYKSEELKEKTIELAKTISSKSQFAVKKAKVSVKATSEMNLQDGLSYEQERFVECFNSHDGKEGINAFIEKRKPNFKGK